MIYFIWGMKGGIINNYIRIRGINLDCFWYKLEVWSLLLEGKEFKVIL